MKYNVSAAYHAYILPQLANVCAKHVLTILTHNDTAYLLTSGLTSKEIVVTMSLVSLNRKRASRHCHLFSK